MNYKTKATVPVVAAPLSKVPRFRLTPAVQIVKGNPKMAVGAGPLLSASGNLSPPAYAGTIALDAHVLMLHRPIPPPAQNLFINFAYPFPPAMHQGNNAVLCAACPGQSLLQLRTAVESMLARMKKALSI